MRWFYSSRQLERDKKPILSFQFQSLVLSSNQNRFTVQSSASILGLTFFINTFTFYNTIYVNLSSLLIFSCYSFLKIFGLVFSPLLLSSVFPAYLYFFLLNFSLYISFYIAGTFGSPSFFVYFFGGLECAGHCFCLCRPFCIFERCLDSNPECCRSKQARYQLTHPSHCVRK
jgi:hypothetical protein